MTQQDQENNGLDFAWAELRPTPEGKLPEPPTFSVFQIDVKTDSPIGRALNNDPLSVLRDQLDKFRDLEFDAETRKQVGDLSEAMDIDGEARMQVLRVNAERPANPTKKKAVVIKYPGNTTVVGVEYKYE
jgi:hypothetical protein